MNMTPVPNFPGYYADDRGVWSIKRGSGARLLQVTGYRRTKATVKTSLGVLNVWAAIATACGVETANSWGSAHEETCLAAYLQERAAS